MNISGIYYFDGRPTPDTDCVQAQRALRSKACCGADYVATAPGLLLLQAGFGRSTPDRGFSSGNAVAWDGRLDNRKELLERYDRRLPDSCSDGELALTAYETDGPSGLRSLIGDWSLAIWDAAQREILLASDYVGIRPLYYVRDPHRIAWASSLEGLRQWTGISELDEQFVCEFLLRSAAVRRPPYRGIEAVPCGHFVSVSEHRTVSSEFWSLPVGKSVSYTDEAEYAQRLRELFETAVAARLRTPGPACTELSGGLDSSSVTCMADWLVRSRSVQTPKVTTFSYDSPGSADSRFIQLVEQARNQSGIHLDARSYPFLSADCLGEAAPLFWGPRLQEIKRHMQQLGSEVLVTGQVGDLVMGNWWDDSEQVGDYVRNGRFVRATGQALAWSRSLHVPVYPILFQALKANLPWHMCEASLSQADPDDSVEPAFKRQAGVVNRKPEVHWLKEVSPGRRKHYWGVNELRKTHLLRCPEPLQDVSCTHPYAHRPLVEYMLTIPAAVVCKPGVPRALMRKAFQGLLPETIRTRRSKAAYNAVFIESLRPLAARLLQGIKQMRLVQHSFVDPQRVEYRLKRLVQNLECNEAQLRRLILLELWLESRQTIGAISLSHGDPVTTAVPASDAGLATAAAAAWPLKIHRGGLRS